MAPPINNGTLCCVGRCTVRQTNNLGDDGISLHTFPKDAELRRQWTNFVKTTRADFSLKSITKNMKICALHFNADDIERPYPIVFANFDPSPKSGKRLARKVRNGAVPCIKYHLYSSAPKILKTTLKRKASVEQPASSSSVPKKQARHSFQSIENKRQKAVSIKV